jgi:hypothetical protein
MSAKLEEFDVEIDESLNINLNDIKDKIPTFTSAKLCEIIVCDRYFGSYPELAVLSMQELSTRRINGDTFDFEAYIDNSFKELPKLDFSLPDIGNVMRQFAGKFKP